MPLSPPTARSSRGAPVHRWVTASRCGVRNDADLSSPPDLPPRPSSLYTRDRGSSSQSRRPCGPFRPSEGFEARIGRLLPLERGLKGGPGRRPLTGLEHLARRAAQSFGVPRHSIIIAGASWRESARIPAGGVVAGRWSTVQSSTATPTIGQSSSPRRSSRYRERRGHLLRQVTGDAEDDERVGAAVLTGLGWGEGPVAPWDS
jgi:hypothetical protein